MKIRAIALAALLALAGCHGQPTAGGLSADDERELDNAAAMLDQQNVFDTSPDGLVANEAEISAEENRAAAANRGGNAH